MSRLTESSLHHANTSSSSAISLNPHPNEVVATRENKFNCQSCEGIVCCNVQEPILNGHVGSGCSSRSSSSIVICYETPHFFSCLPGGGAMRRKIRRPYTSGIGP